MQLWAWSNLTPWLGPKTDLEIIHRIESSVALAGRTLILRG
ncbi:hypothetical protein DF3PB_1090001 [uncultured Defluviicoccus sp.]|uniref:Uncharacterized protein n=1 Tax=metagenome TaxID=256318 RepID=A0A380T8U5_9ZZZZ|nr:hypothetical protein DF3PB_1090001 [uncultured Defluviicoccus sp.]